MSKNNVVKLAGRDTITDPLTELLRTGAEQLIYQAVEAELLELLAEHSERRTEDGNAGVVRNGHLPERELQTGLGPVTVQIPKVRAKTGEPVKRIAYGQSVSSFSRMRRRSASYLNAMRWRSYRKRRRRPRNRTSSRLSA